MKSSEKKKHQTDKVVPFVHGDGFKVFFNCFPIFNNSLLFFIFPGNPFYNITILYKFPHPANTGFFIKTGTLT